MIILKPGDRVRRRGTTWKGVVLESNGTHVKVQFSGPIPEHNHRECLIRLKPRPEKPARVALDVWVSMSDNRQVLGNVYFSEAKNLPAGWKIIHFREVLEPEAKDGK
jgi:hypothetical protein